MSDRIDPAKVIRTIAYAHPVFTRAERRRRKPARQRSQPPAAPATLAPHWGWGFHEDGVVSALRAVEGL